MAIKHVQQILPPPPTHMVGDGFRVHNFFPQKLSFFGGIYESFLLDYNSIMEFSSSSPLVEQEDIPFETLKR